MRLPTFHRLETEGRLRVEIGPFARPYRNGRYLRNLAVPSKSRNFRFGSRPCENSTTFSHGPILFAFSSPEAAQNPINREKICFARPVAKIHRVLTQPRSNRRVQSAFRERSVLAPLSHSVYDRFFWLGGTGSVGLSHRGEIGNHKVAGKIGVTTMAALPRNHEKAVKSRTWRHFSLPSTLQRSARRIANLSKECRQGHLFFAQPRQIACVLGDA